MPKCLSRRLMCAWLPPVHLIPRCLSTSATLSEAAAASASNSREYLMYAATARA
ncbi:hypothetical protein OIE67_37480 [Nonomuraea fuscirosea]|uniref:hypothetical protein n=1 Tax=Nonomuraea fuscirosea TaxID=1291556 RepID=UPI002DDAF335|nr:hypothetical protein [Nonomuraea fuscirosea]WSA49726.1 hypothetical protein OIE67_37480 [Nonomuraea fuscirosea]